MMEALARIAHFKLANELAYSGGRRLGGWRAGETGPSAIVRFRPLFCNLLGTWSEPAADAVNISWIRDLFAD